MTCVLALDTATDACSAALLSGGQLLERFELAPRRQAERILPLIDAVLDEADCSLKMLDAIAFGCGPGSFTGVRLAASVTQGLAFAVDVPVAPVSTLAALALGVVRRQGVRGLMATALDARMGEVYWGLYAAEDNNNVCLLGQEQVIAPSAVSCTAAEQLNPSHHRCYGVGSGWQTYSAALNEAFSVVRTFPDQCPHAAECAVLGAALLSAGKTVSAEHALPVYLRDQVAVRAQ